MGAKNSVNMSFENGFKGVLINKNNSSLKIGGDREEFTPYEMLLGALGSCYYATFLEIANKMKLEYEKINIKINSEKREEVPTFLKNVQIDICIIGAEENKSFNKAFDLAGKYCSVYQTVLKVAEIENTITYK